MRRPLGLVMFLRNESGAKKLLGAAGMLKQGEEIEVETIEMIGM